MSGIEPANAAGPLQGLRVVDLTSYVTGPMCTMILGDMGAEVIRVESKDLLDRLNIKT